MPLCDFTRCLQDAKLSISFNKVQFICSDCSCFVLPFFALVPLDEMTEVKHCSHCHRRCTSRKYKRTDFYCSLECKKWDVIKWERQTKRRCFCLTAAVLQCAQCKKTYYCSKKCQRQDWTKGGHKQKCKQIQRGPFFTSWCWSHVSLYLPTCDISHLLCSTKKIKIQNWCHLLQRDYPFAFQVAKIEGYKHFKLYYKEFHQDQMSIEDYVKIANKERNNRTDAIPYILKIIAKGAWHNLEPLITFDIVREKQIQYLDWLYQLVKANDEFVAIDTFFYLKIAIQCWNLLKNKSYTMWWLEIALKRNFTSFLAFVVEQKQFDTILNLEDKCFLYSQSLTYSFPFFMWIVRAYQEEKRYQISVTLLESDLMKETHKEEEHEVILKKMEEILFCFGKFQEAYCICKQLLQFETSKHAATLNIIQFRLLELKDIPKAKKYIRKMKYEVLSPENRRMYNHVRMSYYLYQHKYDKFCTNMQHMSVDSLKSYHGLLCLAYYFQKEYKKAIGTAFYVSSDDTVAWRYVARSYWHLKNGEAAKKTLDKMRDGTSKCLEFALMYVSTNRRSKARHYWKKVLESNKTLSVFDFEETFQTVKTLMSDKQSTFHYHYW